MAASIQGNYGAQSTTGVGSTSATTTAPSALNVATEASDKALGKKMGISQVQISDCRNPAVNPSGDFQSCVQGAQAYDQENAKAEAERSSHETIGDKMHHLAGMAEAGAIFVPAAVQGGLAGLFGGH
jgi:hypothetical protein